MFAVYNDSTALLLTPVTTSTLDGSPTFSTNWGEELQHAENKAATGSNAYIDTRNLN